MSFLIIAISIVVAVYLSGKEEGCAREHNHNVTC